MAPSPVRPLPAQKAHHQRLGLIIHMVGHRDMPAAKLTRVIGQQPIARLAGLSLKIGRNGMVPEQQGRVRQPALFSQGSDIVAFLPGFGTKTMVNTGNMEGNGVAPAALPFVAQDHQGKRISTTGDS